MRFKKGFTLVELLVVISIIALLVSILMPALGRARKQAKAVVCLVNTKQWGLALSMYTADNDDKFWQGWGGSQQEQSWLVAMYEYYRDTTEILRCPEVSKPLVPGAGSANTFGAWTAWVGHFPVQSTAPDFYEFISTNDIQGSYGVNWLVSDHPDDFSASITKKSFWRNSNASRANDIPVVIDANFWLSRPDTADTAPTYKGEFQFYDNGYEMRRFCIDRHLGYVNAAFMDASARKIGLKELWKMRWSKTYQPIEPFWPEWMDAYQDYSY